MEPNIAKRIYDELKRDLDEQFERKFEATYNARFCMEITDIFQVDIPALLRSGVLKVENERERAIILKWTNKYYRFFIGENLDDDDSSDDELTSDLVETPTTAPTPHPNDDPSLMFNFDALNEESDDQIEFNRKIKIMNENYPNLPFSPNVEDFDNLDDILINSKLAIIYYPLKCAVCCPDRQGAEVIAIKRNRFITYNDFYTECNNYWSSDMCNHCFLEGLEVKNGFQIEPWFGS